MCNVHQSKSRMGKICPSIRHSGAYTDFIRPACVIKSQAFTFPGDFGATYSCNAFLSKKKKYHVNININLVMLWWGKVGVFSAYFKWKKRESGDTETRLTEFWLVFCHQQFPWYSICLYNFSLHKWTQLPSLLELTGDSIYSVQWRDARHWIWHWHLDMSLDHRGAYLSRIDWLYNFQ